jgi:hypothetical protein
LPARYRLKDRMQVLPVAVEIRFPEEVSHVRN